MERSKTIVTETDTQSLMESTKNVQLVISPKSFSQEMIQFSISTFAIFLSAFLSNINFSVAAMFLSHGNDSEVEMAAFSISNSFRVITGEAIILSLNQGTSILLSQAFGFKDVNLARLYFKRNFIFFGFVIIVYSILNVFNYPILKGIGVSENIASKAYRYLQLEILHTFLYGLVDLIKSLLISQKIFRVHLFFTIIFFGLYFLMSFVFLKILNLGLIGLAFVDISCDIYLLICYCSFCFYKRNQIELGLVGKFFSKEIFNLRKIVELVKRNFEISSCFLINLLSTSLNSLLFFPLCSENDLAAYSGAISAYIPLLIFGSSLPVTVSVILAKNSGKGDIKHVKRIILIGVFFVAFTGCVWTVVYFFATDQIMSLFSNNEELHHKQKTLLRIMIGWYNIEISRILINGILRSIGAEKIVTIYMAIIYFIFNLSVSNFAIRYFGITGVLYTMGLCNLFAYICGIVCFILTDLEKNIKKVFCKLADDKLEVIKEEDEVEAKTNSNVLKIE